MKYEKKYIFVGFSIIILLIANQVITHYFIFQKKEDASLMNLAGRQRMLSQRIHLLLIKNIQDEQNKYTGVVLNLIEEWKTSHLIILEGNDEKGISPLSDPELAILTNTNFKIIEEIQQIVLSKDLEDPEIRILLNDKFEMFLAQMELIVKGIEDNANDKLLLLSFVEAVLALLILFVVLLEFRLVILPVFKKIQKNEASLLEKNEALTNSENRLKAILDSTYDINLMISPDYKLLNFNKVANDIGLKYFNKPYILGSDIREYYLKEDIEILEKYMPRVLQGEEFVLEIERTIANQKVWYELTKKPVYDGCGKIIGASTNLKDITIRKQKEYLLSESTLKLKESETKLRAVYNSSLDGYVLISPEYVILSVNTAAQEASFAIFGKKMEENDSILDFTVPESRHMFMEDSGKALKGEYVRRETQVGGLWFQFNYFPVSTAEDGLIGFSMNAINIDKRRLVEEYNTALMQSIPDKFFVLDENGLILDHQSDPMRPVFETVSIIHKKITEVFPLKVAEDFMESILWSLSNQKVSEVSYHIEVQGQDRFYLAKISPLSSNKIIMLSRDVTNIYNQQEEIRKKNNILKGITWQQSHEVRKPIANILGICNMLQRQLAEGEELGADLVQFIHSSAEELDQIVRKIVEQSSDYQD